jgi:isocitrate lyase
MKKLEKKNGFREAIFKNKTDEKIPFFNLGPSNNWRNKLDPNLANKIEKAFSKEMKELGYI